MPVRWAIIHPQNTKNIIIATEIGVWATQDITENNVIWEPFIETMANVRVDMLKFRESDNTLIAATHGRGLFKATYNVEPDTMSPSSPGDDIVISPNPNQGRFNLIYDIESEAEIKISVFDMTGRLVYNDEFYHYPGQFNKAIQLGRYYSGNYFLKLEINNNPRIEKFMIIN